MIVVDGCRLALQVLKPGVAALPLKPSRIISRCVLDRIPRQTQNLVTLGRRCRRSQFPARSGRPVAFNKNRYSTTGLTLWGKHVLWCVLKPYLRKFWLRRRIGKPETAGDCGVGAGAEERSGPDL